MRFKIIKPLHIVGLYLTATLAADAATMDYALVDVLHTNPFAPDGVSIIRDPPWFDAAGSAVVDDAGIVLISINALETSGRHPSQFTYSSGALGWSTTIGGKEVYKNETASCDALIVTRTPCWSVFACIDFRAYWESGKDNEGAENPLFDVEVTLIGETLRVTRTEEFHIGDFTAGSTLVFQRIVPIPSALWLLGSSLVFLGGLFVRPVRH